MLAARAAARAAILARAIERATQSRGRRDGVSNIKIRRDEKREAISRRTANGRTRRDHARGRRQARERSTKRPRLGGTVRNGSGDARDELTIAQRQPFLEDKLVNRALLRATASG
jgi:hypothetical protein